MPEPFLVTKELFRPPDGKQAPQQKTQKPKAVLKDPTTVEEWAKTVSVATDSSDVDEDVAVESPLAQVMMQLLRPRESARSKVVEEEVRIHGAMQERRRLEEVWAHYLHRRTVHIVS